jgi:hypothetical protein
VIRVSLLVLASWVAMMIAVTILAGKITNPGMIFFIVIVPPVAAYWLRGFEP